MSGHNINPPKPSSKLLANAWPVLDANAEESLRKVIFRLMEGVKLAGSLAPAERNIVFVYALSDVSSLCWKANLERYCAGSLEDPLTLFMVRMKTLLYLIAPSWRRNRKTRPLKWAVSGDHGVSGLRLQALIAISAFGDLVVTTRNELVTERLRKKRPAPLLNCCCVEIKFAIGEGPLGPSLPFGAANRTYAIRKIVLSAARCAQQAANRATASPAKFKEPRPFRLAKTGAEMCRL